MTLEHRLRSHYESLTRIIRFVQSADTKAAPVLGVHIALAGTLIVRLGPSYADIYGSGSFVSATVIILIGLYGLFSAAAVALSAWVYVPINPRTGICLIYFEDIAGMDYEDFVGRVTEVNEAIIESQLVDQIHKVSRIASQKMRRVRCAFLFSGPAILLWIALLAWGAVS